MLCLYGVCLRLRVDIQEYISGTTRRIIHTRQPPESDSADVVCPSLASVHFIEHLHCQGFLVVPVTLPSRGGRKDRGRWQQRPFAGAYLGSTDPVAATHVTFLPRSSDFIHSVSELS